MNACIRPHLRLARTALALFGCVTAGAAGAQVTGVAGGGQAFSNLQPSLAVTQLVPTSGLFPSFDTGPASGGTLGFVYAFAGGFAPKESALADGSLLSIAQNSALFSLLGTSFGGNGQVNFGLPDLRGRAVVGSGGGPGLTPWSLGDRFGSAQVPLSLLQMPAHAHGLPGGGLSDPSGGASPFFNVQPSLAMNRLIAVQGAFPGGGGGTPSAFIGQVATFSGTFVPAGWVEAKGQLLSIAQNTALFSLMGTSFGGDGVRTFALPDLRGRVSVGTSEQLPLGSALGEEITTLNAGQLPAHSHSLPEGGATDAAGANQPVNNLQPSLALNHLIALQGVFPSAFSGSGFLAEAPFVGQIVEYAGSFAPDGWALAQGQLLPIAQFETLFQVIGTTYGGDGVQTFALPDLRGRTLVGQGFAPPLGRNLVVGEALGADSVTLGLANLPPHAHTLPVPEPAPWALLLGGLLGLRTLSRRRPGA